MGITAGSQAVRNTRGRVKIIKLKTGGQSMEDDVGQKMTRFRDSEMLNGFQLRQTALVAVQNWCLTMLNW